MAGFASLAAAAALRMASGTPTARSAGLFASATFIALAGFAAAVIVDSPELFAATAAVAFFVMAIALFVHRSEAAVLSKMTEEQRVDVASGLPNERLFHERLAAEHSRTKRTDQRYSVAVFEIDEYDELSQEDREAGMRLLADSLQESIRNTDTLGRIGKTRAGVLLVDTLAEGAVIGCDRARERFFFQSCGHNEKFNVTRPLTVSVGIAAFDDDTVDPGQVLANAQDTLQSLRARGGRGIEVYASPRSTSSAPK
jgi:diguanylate cyclase (GGDEF)-like protein